MIESAVTARDLVGISSLASEKRSTSRISVMVMGWLGRPAGESYASLSTKLQQFYFTAT
jgi:hypothetical protein